MYLEKLGVSAADGGGVGLADHLPPVVGQQLGQHPLRLKNTVHDREEARRHLSVEPLVVGGVAEGVHKEVEVEAVGQAALLAQLIHLE